jgi:putative hydrolase of the HAD superfamily
LRCDDLRLDKMVDAVLISEAEGLWKPDYALFRRAVDRLGVRPEQCLFVGENPAADILGAHAAGMRTAWLRRGASWPDELPPPSDAIIDALPEVLCLIDGNDASGETTIGS